MSEKNLVQKIYLSLSDFIFPKFCVGCQKEGSYLCQDCRGKILEVESLVCPGCGRLSQSGVYCEKCRLEEFKNNFRRKPLKGIVTALYYEEGPTKEIIHNFKYNSVLEFKTILAEKMAEKIKVLGSIDLITFAPLHPRRLAQRGYNQAEILAREISSLVKLPCQGLLVKTKNTKRQVGLIRKKRRKNLEGVFRVKESVNIKGKKIIIVDDISTTGTTLNECARVLKKAGAKEVWGLVAARG